MWINDKTDLRALAHRQRQLLWMILFAFIIQFVPFFIDQFSGYVQIGVGIFTLAVLVLTIVGVARMLAAMGTHGAWIVVAIIMMLAPCANLLVLLVINSRATGALQRAGLKVGFMGVRDEDVVRLLSANRCHGCGYLLIGNVSNVCPECGLPVGTFQ
ncbi:MAG: hypothetical protein HJJLKODD_01621 [Phycisphaerae bacterium]|nr:hypothetical protein [Phycisphaerae bacterium]